MHTSLYFLCILFRSLILVMLESIITSIIELGIYQVLTSVNEMDSRIIEGKLESRNCLNANQSYNLLIKRRSAKIGYVIK